MSYSEDDDFWNGETRDEAARRGRHAARPRFARPVILLGVLVGALAVAFGVSAVFGWLPSHSIAPSAGLAPADNLRGAGAAVSRRPSATVPPSRRPHVKAVSPRRPAARPIVVRVQAPPPAATLSAPPSAPLPTKAPAKAPAKPPVTAAPVTHQISGDVQCSTMAVEGVWIAAENGGSGWAKWTAMSSASTVRYSYSLPNGGSYAVHVGCGGSPADWLTTPDSNVVAGTVNNFICYDVAGQPAFDSCSHIN
jgi:hypothetical protein